MIRANSMIPVRLTTIVRLTILVPRAAIKAMANRIKGRELQNSKARMTKKSTLPPKYPATIPRVVPMMVFKITASMPMPSATLAP